MKFLIAPWGNPSNWSEVTYVYDGESLRSKTSLKILQKSIQPDKTIIIGLDTLAEEGRNYQEVKINAEGKIKEYADKFGLENYEVVVAPGIGTFPNGAFFGDALDYYYYIIARLSLILLKDPKNTLEIHLDLTHGINYSTILTYKAVKEIGGVLSIFKNVRFRAYNADPSLPKVADKLSINVIEDSPLIPIPFNEKISQGKPLKPMNLSPEDRKRLFSDELKSAREISSKEVSAFIGALYNCLPLALFRFYPDKDKLREVITTVLNSYEKYIEVKKQDKLEVVKKVKFENDFKVYVFAYIIAVMLESLNLISTRKKEVTINEIENLKENLFRFDERFELRLNQDIHDLKNNLEKKEIKGWHVYNAVLGEEEKGHNKRNFLAHSGFEKNVIEVNRENEKLLLRFHEERILTVMKFCQSGLK